jgi:HD-GYP domain-containing protein (c-di-GMP phosphodiesterase class II)
MARARTRSGRFLEDRSFDLKDQLKQLTHIGIALTAERDLRRLLDKILYEARRFTRAEAGTLYVREKGDRLWFCAVQNDAIPASTVSANCAAAGCEECTIPITRQSIAGYVASTGRLLNIRDVYEIPATEEYRFNDEFDRKTGYRTESVLAVPMRSPAGEIVGVIQLINRRPGTGQGVSGFDRRFEELVEALASQAAVALANARLTEDLKRSYEETIVRLARAAEYRDADTGEHIRRMSRYTAEIARAMGWSAEAVAEIQLAAPLHDVGKIALPDGVLRKPARLTPEERALLERHTTYGGEILDGSDVPILVLARDIALTHHERWDGTGYPRKLSGEAIPVAGRICALADVFDALTAKRVYKEAMPVEKACEIIREGRGTHFDPAVADAFFRCLDRILEIKARYGA